MTQKNYVLIPGAWHGAWVWQPVARRLREAGHRALALTMPGVDGDDPSGVTLADAVDYVVDTITRYDLRDVVLAAHSWGGYPATGAALRVPDRIAEVAFVSAVVPEPGVSQADELPAQLGAFVRATIAASGTVPIDLDSVRTVMLPDEPEPVRRMVYELLVPHPGRYFLDALDATALGVPARYVLARDDRALAKPGAVFAARLGVAPVLVPGGHETLLTHPDEVAKALL
ncbi:alpha/beta fold hydrolase [Catenuloplanes atrovinosus]|uniref:Pimeloyl-ACP methyl ester carboxylesterase n=1 Tax=Catenuloplanes atrovinosus TaxID=137266 RepID=A0AAE3YKP4_9ACTN|nr:alpha/beta hydrolase [Catenuloplanes atrovinosus]MDR7274292.1 pimeloyl-ACP methyl ester carboxylesterase [Catenuloplanes atrovinosus]